MKQKTIMSLAIRPSVKQKLKSLSEKHEFSMSSFIEQLILNQWTRENPEKDIPIHDGGIADDDEDNDKLNS